MHNLLCLLNRNVPGFFTCAVITVHLYDHPVEMQPVLDFVLAHDLRAIEDASQTHNSTHQEQRVESFGDIGSSSLYYRGKGRY